MNKCRFVAGLAVLMLVLCAVPAFADDSPVSAVTVLSGFKAAAGGQVWDGLTNMASRCSITQGGLSGSDIEWDNLTTGQYADQYTIGGVSGGNGFDGFRYWVVGEGGIPRYLDSAEDMHTALTNSYLIALAYWYPGRRPGAISAVRSESYDGRPYSVVTVNPAGGYPVDMWFDNSSRLMTRSVMTSSLQTITTTFSDYRMVNGIEMPYQTTVSTGNPKYDLTIKIISLDINQQFDSSVYQIPVAAAPDYVLPPGAKSVTVPFNYSLGHIYVPVKINGKGPFDAILDSGGRLAFTPTFAAENKIESEGQLPGSGIGLSTVREGISKVNQLSIGGITISKLSAIVVPMPTPTETPLIGSEIFLRFVVNIDFDNDTLTLTPFTDASSSFTIVPTPFRFHDDIPEVDGDLDGIHGDFMIDTGSGNSIDLFHSFITANGLIGKYDAPFTANGGFGIGGAQTVSVARAGEFSVGAAEERNPLIFLSNAGSGSYSDKTVSGNIGTGFLHRFNLTFNYSNQTICFQPNSFFSDPDAYERLGITIDSTDDGSRVVGVIDGSPAALAGIASGDLITDVNGHKLREGDGFWFVQQMMLPAGTTLVLTVRHGRQSRQAVVILKDLI